MYYLNEKNDENNQSIHKTCYDLGSLFENWFFMNKITCDPLALKNQKKEPFLNV